MKKSKSNFVWAEKYRPKSIKDILSTDAIKQKLNMLVDKRDIPHIIITGEPGIGKTTTSLCLARDLLGKEYAQFVLELNASNDRGIKSVQRIIVPFCQLALGGKAHCKIILLDEADSMTDKEQQFISKLMDKYGKTTKFIFTCNSSTSIIESIQSRCDIIRFSTITPDLMKIRLKYICEEEQVTYDKDGMKLLMKIANGDIRVAINILQSIHMGLGELNVKNITILCNVLPNEIIEAALVACVSGELKTAIEEINKLRNNGYSCLDIITSIFSVTKDSKKFDDNQKIIIMKEISTTYTIIKKGVQSALQLHACLSRISLANL